MSESRPLHGQDGFVVVAVLWMLAAFAALAGIYAVYVGTTATVYGAAAERLRAEVAARSALELMAGRLRDAARLPPVTALTARIGDARVTAEAQTESGRVDLNAAPKALLAGLFTSLGAAGDAAAAAADRIVAWRTAPRTMEDGAEEASAYRTAGRTYVPRQSAFPHVGEIWLLLNLPEAIITRSLPFLTVYSGKPSVNILAAAPEVVAGLPGMTSETTHDVLAQRQAVTGEGDLVALLGQSARYATLEVARAFRVSLEVNLDTGRRMRAETVILIAEQDTEPYRILSWVDQSDLPERRR